MLSQFIELGDKVTIIQTDKNDSEKAKEKENVSKVVSINDEMELHITMLPLSKGETNKFCFYTKRGLYYCLGNLIDEYEQDDEKIAVIRLEKNLTRSQRREYFRVEQTMSIGYRNYTQDELLEDNHGVLKWNKAVLTDLGGGGARFYCKENLKESTLVTLRLRLNFNSGTAVVKVISKVISSKPMEKKEGIFDNRVEFADIDIALRELIIKYVFEEERKQLKRRKKD